MVSMAIGCPWGHLASPSSNYPAAIPVALPSLTPANVLPGHKPRAMLVTAGYGTGFALVCSLFFLWAIAANFNDLLIRQFQKALSLDRLEAGFVPFVFYIGYFLVALPAGLVMRRFGYRVGIIVGLSLYAAGALLFYPAAEVRQYSAFLAALFVIASGAAFLETAANPYSIAMGDPARAALRANLAQSFNGLGVFIAPLIGSRFIFSGIEYQPDQLARLSAAGQTAFHSSEARTVQSPYLVLAGIILVIAIAFCVVKLPDLRAPKGASQSRSALSILKIPSLRWAVVAQFFYVGGQVSIWSYFIDLVKILRPETPERTAAYILSVSLASFMVGRFVGTALLKRVRADYLLFAYAFSNVLLLATALVTHGWVAITAIGLTCFFMSIQFPTIFSFGVRELGNLAMVGSSYIVMAVVGGAVLPLMMGLIDRHTGSLQLALLSPMACFGVVALYASRLKAATSPVGL